MGWFLGLGLVAWAAARWAAGRHRARAMASRQVLGPAPVVAMRTTAGGRPAPLGPLPEGWTVLGETHRGRPAPRGWVWVQLPAHEYQRADLVRLLAQAIEPKGGA
jgi:hypothetical protein